jgi:hypothetical protein
MVGGLRLASSQYLFNTLQYALFAAPGVIVLLWVAWRIMAWCLFQSDRIWAWTRGLPVRLRCPVLVGLLILGWPLLLLALVAWILVCLFPGLATEEGDVPRLFAPNRSKILSQLFLFFVFLPLVTVPLKFLAHHLAGPQISVWHWALVYGPVPVLLFWLVARLRRKPAEF